MSIFKYDDITYSEFTTLNREKTTVCLNVTPLKLQESSDLFIQEIAHKLSETRKEWSFLILPTLFVGADVEKGAGSIGVRPTILRSLVYAYCKQLAKEGFKNIIIVSNHAGPRHLVVLEEVAAKMEWLHHVRMVSASSHFLTRVETGRTVTQVLTEETVPLLEQFLDGANVKKQFRSKFYYVPYLRTDFKLLIIIIVYVVVFGVAWRMLMHLMEAYR